MKKKYVQNRPPRIKSSEFNDDTVYGKITFNTYNNKKCFHNYFEGNNLAHHKIGPVSNSQVEQVTDVNSFTPTTSLPRNYFAEKSNTFNPVYSGPSTSSTAIRQFPKGRYLKLILLYQFHCTYFTYCWLYIIGCKFRYYDFIKNN